MVPACGGRCAPSVRAGSGSRGGGVKVTYSWLREFAPFSAHPLALAESMSALGMTVESVRRVGHDLEGIVVARVMALRPHPDADKVQRVDVDSGDGKALQVWCGASNMAVDDLVPLATIGTVMPGGMEIGRRTILGEPSYGMLCSPAELGLGDDAGGILVLPAGLKPGAPLRDALGLESDTVYDLEINPNRPDAMSVVGVARDLAGFHRVPFSPIVPFVPGGGPPIEELASVEILDPERCGRFVTRVLQGVTVGPSPPWLANRLTLLGMRPINNVVDVSNYVMLELGAPNHAYDLARLGQRRLRVRRAAAGETLTTLDDVARRLTGDDLVICDGDDRPVGIAGVMGGADAEIGSATDEVLVEVAWWEPTAIARTARRLGLRTEASARFERGTDPEGLVQAVDRFVELLAVDGGTTATGLIDERGRTPERVALRVRTARTNAVLGTALKREAIGRYLTPIGFTASAVGDSDEDNEVMVPTFRPDVIAEIDVIEEVARHHGYATVGAAVPPTVHAGALSARQRRRRELRAALVGLGLREAMPLPFLAPGDLSRAGLPDAAVAIANPLVAEESVLRTSLLPGLLSVLSYNGSHRNHGLQLWEIGRVFRRPPEPRPLPEEAEHLGVALGGAEAPAAVDVATVVFEVLGVAHELLAAEPAGLHPARSASVMVAGRAVGAVGVVDPTVLAAHAIAERVAWLEVDLGLLLDEVPGARDFVPVSRYPSSDIDLAFDVDDAVPASAVQRTLRDALGELGAGVELFDVYRGPGVEPGRRSLAFRCRLQAADRTLTDADVGEVRAGAVSAVEASHPARLRA